MPKEEWKIFKNHHEPIIDEETWNTVQRIRNSKRRPTKTGKQSIFSGHLFCKDCGAKLYYCTANNFTADKDFYRCSNYKNNSTNACTSHNIRDIVLKEFVLEQVQQVVSYIHNFEWLFIFVDKVKKYTEIKELTPEIINELIDKILVHQQTKVGGKNYQQIDIYYSGVGIISVSANEYDFEKEFHYHRNYYSLILKNFKIC